MAVDETTTAPEDNSAVADVELEDIEVSAEELAGDEPEEDEVEIPESEDKATDTEDEVADVTEDDSEVEPEPELSPADETKAEKARNKEMAEKRLQAKADRETQLKKEQQDYVAEADTEDPRDLAVRQLQVDAYNNRVDANTNKLTNGYERAIKDFDVLRSKDPIIQDFVNDAVDEFQARHVQIDKYGNPTEVSGDLYQFLQAKADSITKLTGIRADQQEKSKNKEKSKVLATPTRAPKEPKKDPDLEAFDEEAYR